MWKALTNGNVLVRQSGASTLVLIQTGQFYTVAHDYEWQPMWILANGKGPYHRSTVFLMHFQESWNHNLCMKCRTLCWSYSVVDFHFFKEALFSLCHFTSFKQNTNNFNPHLYQHPYHFQNSPILFCLQKTEALQLKILSLYFQKGGN